jgi:hypothetical protein
MKTSNWTRLSNKVEVYKYQPLGYNTNPHSGVGFCREKIPKILAGTARVVASWFSQYSCLKVQNFAIIGQF